MLFLSLTNAPNVVFTTVSIFNGPMITIDDVGFTVVLVIVTFPPPKPTTSTYVAPDTVAWLRSNELVGG